MPVDMTQIDPFASSGGTGPIIDEKIHYAPIGYLPESTASTTQSQPMIAGEEAGTSEYGFDLPSSWSGLEDFWSNLMGGGANVGLGSEYGSALNWLQNYMQQGSPFDVEAYREQQLPWHQRQIEQAQQQAMEEYGLQGLGRSTPAIQQLGQIASDYENQFSSNLANIAYQAHEADIANRLQAALGIPSAANIGAQLGLANLSNQMTGANQLLNYGYAPLQLGQGLFNLGSGYQTAEQAQYDAMYNDPYMQMAMSMLGSPGMQYMPDQYTSGFGTTMLDIGTSLLPYGSSFQNWIGGGGTSGLNASGYGSAGAGGYGGF